MIVSTKNEYGELKSVLVGSVDNFSWPVGDKEFDDSIDRSTYEVTLDRGAVSQTVINEAREDLDRLVEHLTTRGVQVTRPQIDKPTWAYSARDIILAVGNTVIECPTPFSSRSRELDLYPAVKQSG